MTEVVAEPAEAGRPSATAMIWSARQRARLVRVCTAIVRDPVTAEDLAQETLLEAWRHQHKLTDPSGADAWLNAIARNVCRRWLTAQRRKPVPAVDPQRDTDESSSAPDLDAVLERDELVELLNQALAHLPPATREALVGHYVEQRSHAEIADRLGTSADAVSMRVTRGKARLRFLLETRFGDEAIAEGWLRRDEAGWRPTRLRCVDCGSARVSLRHTADELAFRCQACDPFGLKVRLPLDTPVFSALLGNVRRPSAIEARVAAWSMQYWSPAEPTGQVQCVRCGRSVPMRPYVRADGHNWSGRHGWYVTCPACGEQVSGSVAGHALALPEVMAARRREPRLRSLPIRDVEHDGLPAKLVGFAGPDGVESATAVFLRDTLRLVHVETTTPLPVLTADGG